MQQNDKELLLKDLCVRSFYSVKVTVLITSYVKGQEPNTEPIELVSVNAVYGTCTVGNIYSQISGVRMFDRKGEVLCKPYLRPMSSMTEEEIKEYKHLVAFGGNSDGVANFIDWLNAHHFDYHKLIELGLALEAPQGMYN